MRVFLSALTFDQPGQAVETAAVFQEARDVDLGAEIVAEIATTIEEDVSMRDLAVGKVRCACLSIN